MGNIKMTYRLTILTLFTIVLFGCHRDSNKLAILFDNVEGLKEGSNVYYKGLMVGNVIKMDLFKDQVVVDIKLRDSILIPVNSKFIINPSVIGYAHITIEPSDETNFLSSKDTVTGQIIKEQLFDDIVSDSTRRNKVKQAIQKIGEGISDLVQPTSKDTARTP